MGPGFDSPLWKLLFLLFPCIAFCLVFEGSPQTQDVTTHPAVHKYMKRGAWPGEEDEERRGRQQKMSRVVDWAMQQDPAACMGPRVQTDPSADRLLDSLMESVVQYRRARVELMRRSLAFKDSYMQAYEQKVTQLRADIAAAAQKNHGERHARRRSELRRCAAGFVGGRS